MVVNGEVMSKVYIAPVLSAALEKFKEIVKSHAESGGKEGRRLVVFCEDRLSLAAERAVCEAVGGTFSVSVYTLSRFLSGEAKSDGNVLTSQGSAMAMRKLIEANRENLQLFKRLSAANAAQEVYDTIALLYSSKISADDLAGAEADGRLLKRKLHDLELLYRAYSDYLRERGAVDRNAYLRRLPDVIRSSPKIAGADAVFLGFQAFTASVSDCVRACFETADNVYGIFTGGNEQKYVREAWTAFVKIAQETGAFNSAFIENLPSPLIPAAEHLRKYVLEPESFHKSVSLDIVRGQLLLCEATDEEEECQFIASQILKCVREEGVRYREISVMLPDINGVQPALERAFGEYGVPMYVDRRYPLSSHSVCPFILDYLACAADGCRPESVLAVVGSPVFCGNDERSDKDMFVNYLLRAAAYRGGVKKPVNEEVCKECAIDYEAAERVRARFIGGLKILPSRVSDSSAFCKAVRELLEYFDAENRLKSMSEDAEERGFASVAAMCGRAYGAVIQVIDEAEKLIAGERISVAEYSKILKSGFNAAEISLIPPRHDAVFVSDLSGCANTGSKVLFVGGLTDAVPAASQDTAILTDGELSSLEKIKLAVSPKISQVNKRVREITALNLCAFSRRLYLVYPMRSGGEECGVSEIIDYVKHLFTVDGVHISPVPVRDLSVTVDNFPYLCARPAPALRQVTFYLSGDKDCGERAVAAVWAHLKERDECGEELTKEVADKQSAAVEWRKLYGDSVSPTSLETYFACPYKAFMQQGLRLAERREGTFRPLDSGNFIHTVLEEVAKKLNAIGSEEECAAIAGECAERLLGKSAYFTQSDDGGAAYTAGALVGEARTISVGMYRQLKNSRFTVEDVEKRCRVGLDGGLTVGGRIDRVDCSDEYVRVIDYKTGHIDDKPASYYMGLKLQLPLYLTAAAEGRRAAGAYYFPANLEYSAEGTGEFTLKGFMDGSEEVVRRSDVNVQEKCRSAYVGAYLNGRSVDRAMTKEDFADFLEYSTIIAERGAAELARGEIAPSPVCGECDKCAYAGCCGYDRDKQGEREEVSCDCGTIAAIVRANKTGGDV